MQSTATTVREYLDSLPADRKAALEIIRAEILKNLPEGYQETMQYGMIGYNVPLSIYPGGYLGKKDTPLPFAALASQKNHMAVYLMNIYSDQDQTALSWFLEEYKATGKKMDVGKSCVRFKKLADLPVELIGKAIAKTSVQEFIKMYESGRKSLANAK